jgi:hypothetical protein
MVVFPIPRRILQVGQLKRRGFWNRSGRGGLGGLGPGRKGQRVVHEPRRVHDCALGLTGWFVCLATPRGRRDCDATPI